MMNILSAPTSLGNRPYESDGTARLTTLGPEKLLQQQIVARLHASEIGVVAAADYRDFVRPPGGIRNEDLVLAHVRAIAAALEPHAGFTLILGGDCSVLLGSLLGLSRGRDLGLVYLDGHSDFNIETTSEGGGVAGMGEGHGRRGEALGSRDQTIEFIMRPVGGGVHCALAIGAGCCVEADLHPPPRAL